MGGEVNGFFWVGTLRPPFRAIANSLKTIGIFAKAVDVAAYLHRVLHRIQRIAAANRALQLALIRMCVKPPARGNGGVSGAGAVSTNESEKVSKGMASENVRDPGLRILRNAAYFQYAAMTKDDA